MLKKNSMGQTIQKKCAEIHSAKESNKNFLRDEKERFLRKHIGDNDTASLHTAVSCSIVKKNTIFCIVTDHRN